MQDQALAGILLALQAEGSIEVQTVPGCGRGRRYYPAAAMVDCLPSHMVSGIDVQMYARSLWWIEKTLRRLGTEAGLSYKLTAHILRHGLAWTLKTSEMPIAIMQQVMRHRHIQTTIDMYGRLQPHDIRTAYQHYLKGRA